MIKMHFAAVWTEEDIHQAVGKMKADSVARSEGAIRRRPINAIDLLELLCERRGIGGRQLPGACHQLLTAETLRGGVVLVE